MDFYGKFWELSGNWVEITKDRFDNTSFPAIYMPGHSSEELVVKNLPNIKIEGCYPRSLTKTFPCGRKFTWSEDRYTRILELVKMSLRFNNYEDIQIEKITREKKWFEERYNEVIKSMSDLHKELDGKNSKIYQIQTNLDNLASDLVKILEINEKGGSGSRKTVRELISKWVEYKEDDEDGFQHPSIKLD